MATATFLGTYSTKGMPGDIPLPGAEKMFWFIWEDSLAKTYLMQPLGQGFEPTGPPRLLPPKNFRQHFTREPRVTLLPDIHPDVADYLQSAFSPGQPREDDGFQVRGGREAEPRGSSLGDDTIDLDADDIIDLISGQEPKPRAKRQPPAQARPTGRKAEVRQGPAERLDRELRAEFAKAAVRLRNGQTKDAAKMFIRLAERRDGIVPSHKHMFTDFGVDLRKSKLPDLALKHFSRAVELCPEDSHASFNLARILYEMGKMGKAREFLERALELEPDLEVAQRLLRVLEDGR